MNDSTAPAVQTASGPAEAHKLAKQGITAQYWLDEAYFTVTPEMVKSEAAPTEVILPPKFGETDPDVAAAEKLEYDLKVIEALRAELKDWRNPYLSVVMSKANQDHWWKRYDFHGNLMPVEIPKVHTMEEVEAHADQGIPTWLIQGEGKTTFGPQVLFAVVQEAMDFQRDELDRTLSDVAARESSRLKSVADMLLTPEISWMVKDKVHSTGLFQLYGPSYAGKTVVMVDLVMSWCAGLPTWQGYELCNNGERQDAVYVAAEGGAAVSVHVDAWLKYHTEVNPEDLSGLLFLDGGDGDHMFLGIGKNSDVEESDSWARLKQEIRVAGIKPTVMIFDTQIDLAPGVEENSNTDMVGVLREVKRLGDSLGFMAIVIHHTGHDDNKARGASGMMGKCDAQAKLSVISDGKARLSWTKVKGRAKPTDTISYHIQGWKDLPDLDSEGAVCIPIGKLEAAFAEHVAAAPTDERQLSIFNALNGDKSLSGRSIAETVGLGKDSKELKDALVWMVGSKMLDKTGKAAQTRYSLSAMAVAPSEY